MKDDSLAWYLNGSLIGPFRGLSEESAARLKHVGTFYGCEIFTDDEMPRDMIELRDKSGNIVALIHGLEAKR